MITIISPAKNMKPKKVDYALSLPVYLKQSEEIFSVLRKYSPWDLQELMGINESLAQDSADRNATVQFDENGFPAIEIYDGIQYKYMEPRKFSEKERSFAQKHIRILSGAYGVLRPYDSIYEYRLEMSTRLKVQGSKNLYEYWNRLLYDDISRQTDCIINLASAEYGKCIKKYVDGHKQFITCTFKVYHKGKYKVLATAAKMARGQMVRYIVENRIDSPKLLKGFDMDGYAFQERVSNETEYVFYRE